jgi:hypothetical protein
LAKVGTTEGAVIFKERLLEPAEIKEPLESVMVPLGALNEVPEDTKDPEPSVMAEANVRRLPETAVITPVVPPEVKVIPGQRLAEPIAKSS